MIQERRKRLLAIINKLIFTLCRSRAETTNQNECKHTDSERFFIGTWTTDEVNKVLRRVTKSKEPTRCSILTKQLMTYSKVM